MNIPPIILLLRARTLFGEEEGCGLDVLEGGSCFDGYFKTRTRNVSTNHHAYTRIPTNPKKPIKPIPPHTGSMVYLADTVSGIPIQYMRKQHPQKTGMMQTAALT